MKTRIEKANLIPRHAYWLHSRNLLVGVFDGGRGFVGIREKFGDEYLFREYFNDGGVFGTVDPLVDLGEIPAELEVKESEPTIDRVSGRFVAFDRPVVEGGKGWFFTDNGESNQEIRPVSFMYKPLFDYLKELENSEQVTKLRNERCGR